MNKSLIAFTVLLLVGCAGTTPSDAPITTSSAIDSSDLIDLSDLKSVFEFSPDNEDMISPEEKIKLALLDHFKEWESVRYRYGGMSKHGVDCSGFVYMAFLNQFGIKLPRNSNLQVKLGTSVAQDELRPGDLIFFKTGRSTRHVGIYLDHHRFIHASTSQGVTTSSLESKYWANAYWTARRLDHQLDIKALEHHSS
jgi:hypothetical protein